MNIWKNAVIFKLFLIIKNDLPYGKPNNFYSLLLVLIFLGFSSLRLRILNKKKKKEKKRKGKKGKKHEIVIMLIMWRVHISHLCLNMSLTPDKRLNHKHQNCLYIFRLAYVLLLGIHSVPHTCSSPCMASSRENNDSKFNEEGIISVSTGPILPSTMAL